MAQNIVTSNRMSATQLVTSQNSALQFIQNPKTNKVFFVCGNIRGYVSPNAAKIMDTCELKDLQYGEVSIDGNAAVPCLMIVGNSQQNVKRTLGAELLR